MKPITVKYLLILKAILTTKEWLFEKKGNLKIRVSLNKKANQTGFQINGVVVFSGKLCSWSLDKKVVVKKS